MRNAASFFWSFIGFCALLTLGSVISHGASVSGQARAIRTSIVGLSGTTTTTIADTGTLSGPSDVRQASAPTGTVPSLVSGNTLHATTLGWPDQVKSEASLAGLTVTVAGNTIGAGFVMARASAVQGFPATGTVSIDGLSINGVPVWVTGSPNQTIGIPGGLVVINEQQTSPTNTVVNALHIAVTGVADVVIASARAGVQ